MGAFVILTLTVAGTITDRWVRSQARLGGSAARERRALPLGVSEIDEVIFRTDAAGRWTFLNPAWTQITGFTVDETLGMSLETACIRTIARARPRPCTARRRHRRTTIAHEVRYVTKTGGSRWVEVHARATRDRERCARRNDRRHSRRHRASPGEDALRSRARSGRSGEPREERVPVAHEPRAAHAAERHSRLRPADGARGDDVPHSRRTPTRFSRPVVISSR